MNERFLFSGLNRHGAVPKMDSDCSFEDKALEFVYC